MRLDERGLAAAAQTRKVLVRHLNEAIGVRLDARTQHAYFTDLGGSLYRCDLDSGDCTKLFADSSMALTGLTIL